MENLELMKLTPETKLNVRRTHARKYISTQIYVRLIRNIEIYDKCSTTLIDQKEKDFVHYLWAIPEVKVPQIKLKRNANSNLYGGLKLFIKDDDIVHYIMNTI